MCLFECARLIDFSACTRNAPVIISCVCILIDDGLLCLRVFVLVGWLVGVFPVPRDLVTQTRWCVLHSGKHRPPTNLWSPFSFFFSFLAFWLSSWMKGGKGKIRDDEKQRTESDLFVFWLLFVLVSSGSRRRIWAVTSVGSFSSRDFKRRTAASIRARPSTRVAKSWKLTSISPPSVCSCVQFLFTMTRLLYSLCFLLVSSRNHVGGRSDWTIGHFRPTVQGALRRQGQPAGDHRLAEERRWIHYKFVTHSLSLFIVSLVVAPSSSHIWYTYLELVQPTSSLGFISFYRTVVVCSIRP